MFKESAIRDSQSVSNAVGEHVSKVVPGTGTTVRVVTARATSNAVPGGQTSVTPAAGTANSGQAAPRAQSVQIINIPRLTTAQSVIAVRSATQQPTVTVAQNKSNTASIATNATVRAIRPTGSVLYFSGNQVQKQPVQSQVLVAKPATELSRPTAAPGLRGSLVTAANVVRIATPVSTLSVPRNDGMVRGTYTSTSVNLTTRVGDRVEGPIVIDNTVRIPTSVTVRQPLVRPGIPSNNNRMAAPFIAKPLVARAPQAILRSAAPMRTAVPSSTVRLVTNLQPNITTTSLAPQRPLAVPKTALQPQPQPLPHAHSMPNLKQTSSAPSRATAQQSASITSSLSVLEPTEELEEIGLTETYSIYEPKKLKLGKPHPDPVVETSSLSSVEPPDIHYKPRLPRSVIEQGRLSSLQLEAVVYACQRHNEFLPNGERAGYFIGDGAGVGKGRAIAGIIYENWLHGRQRAIWLSVSSDLKFDAERDLYDVIGAELQSPPTAGPGAHLDALSNRPSRQTGLSLADVRELLASATNSAAGLTFDSLETPMSGSSNDKPKEEALVEEAPAGVKQRRGPKVPVYALNKLSYGKINGEQNGRIRKGVVFTTYSSLIAESNSSDVNAKYNTRLKQLLRWAGEQFDGVIVFDECHRAKNLLPGTSGKSTKTGLAVLRLQAALPRARIVYASATGASEPRNMAYMVRLGLWGVGTAFKDFAQCLEMLEKRGVGAMELLAMEMKQRGMYIARQLSFYGVHFRIEPVALSDDFVDIYNRSVDYWTNLKRQIDYALSRLGEAASRGGDGATGVEKQIWSQFWSAHQRFFKYLCISAKLQHCVELTRNALDQGKCVVIGLQSTGESKLVQALGSAANGELTEFVSSAKEVLRSFVNKHFPSTDTERASADRYLAELTDLVAGDCDIDALLDRPAGGRKRKPLASQAAAKKRRKLLDNVDGDFDEAELESEADALFSGQRTGSDQPTSSTRTGANSMWNSSVNPDSDVFAELNSIKRDLLDQIEALGCDLPANSLDQLIEALGGPSCVAEMTGRRLRTVTDQMSGDVVVETRAEPDVSIDLVNHLEKVRFMDGTKLIAIISDAASSGISLQADRRAANQRKRVHITLELAWSADRAVQQFGRTHRSNQVCAPEYVFMISELAGEQRFASTVARRLESLGALTQGDRRAATESSNDLSRFNIDTKYGQQALERTLASLSPTNRALLRSVGLVPADTGSNEIETGNITLAKFLNRLLGLHVTEQNALFDQFVSALRSVILQAKLDGRLELGMLDLGAAEGEQVVLVSKQFLSVTRAHLYTAQLERGLTFEKALQMYAATLHHDSGSAGFYLSRAKHGIRFVPILALPDFRNQPKPAANPKAGAPSKPAGTGRLYRVYMPNTGLKAKFMTEEELSADYRRVESREMQPIWNDLYVSTERSCVHAYWYAEQCARESRTGVPCDIGKRIRTLYVLTGTILSTFKTLDNAILGQQQNSATGTSSTRDKPTLPKLQLIRLRLNRNDIEHLERLEREEEYERSHRAETGAEIDAAKAATTTTTPIDANLAQDELADATRVLDEVAHENTAVKAAAEPEMASTTATEPSRPSQAASAADAITPAGLSKMVRDSIIGCLLQPQFVPLLRRVTSTPEERVYHFSSLQSASGATDVFAGSDAIDADLAQFDAPADESNVFVGFGMDDIDAEFA